MHFAGTSQTCNGTTLAQDLGNIPPYATTWLACATHRLHIDPTLSSSRAPAIHVDNMRELSALTCHPLVGSVRSPCICGSRAQSIALADHFCFLSIWCAISLTSCRYPAMYVDHACDPSPTPHRPDVDHPSTLRQASVALSSLHPLTYIERSPATACTTTRRILTDVYNPPVHNLARLADTSGSDSSCSLTSIVVVKVNTLPGLNKHRAWPLSSFLWDRSSKPVTSLTFLLSSTGKCSKHWLLAMLRIVGAVRITSLC